MTDNPIKETLNRMPYGFYSITSRNGDDVNAMVANWVMQTSFTPRLLAVGLAKKSYTYSVIESGKVFAVNLFLKEDQESMMPFTKGRHKKADKMDEAVFSLGPETGCPILSGAAAFVECRLVKFIDIGGDHDLMVGEIVGGQVLKPGDVTDTLTLPHVGWNYSG